MAAGRTYTPELVEKIPVEELSLLRSKRRATGGGRGVWPRESCDVAIGRTGPERAVLGGCRSQRMRLALQCRLPLFFRGFAAQLFQRLAGRLG